MTASHALAMSRSLPVPALPALGNLDAYISAVNRLPMLSAEEEQSCARKFRDEQDLPSARTLVLSHLRLVVSISRQFLGYGLPQADLIQEGNVGLMKAVKRFDPDRGVRLVSFAMHWIRAELHEYIIRNWRLVKVATTKAQRKLFFNLRSMKQDGAGLSTEGAAEIARTLDVRERDVLEMDTRLHGQDISIEPLDADDADAPVNPSAWLTSEGTEPTQVMARRAHDRLQGEGLESALNTLDARSRHIIESRWLQDEELGARTLQDLATEYGVSAERIRQIEAKALRKMRETLAEFQS